MNARQKRTIESYDKTARNFMDTIGKLKNYDATYDYLITKIQENDSILDLACGPGQISLYINSRKKVKITGVDLSEGMLAVAKENMPEGTFIRDSIVSFRSEKLFDAIILGFGIPYLKKEEVKTCIANSLSLLRSGGYFYLSFMDGEREGFETTSFGGANEFYICYHKKADIEATLKTNNTSIIKEYVLDYKEADGSVTKDVILIAEKH